MRLTSLLRMAFFPEIAVLVLISIWPLPIKAQTANTSATPPTKTAEPPINNRKIHEAENAYVAGARLLDHGNLAAAEEQFTKAATLNPGNPDYLRAATLAHEHRVTNLVQQAGKARLLGQAEKSQELLTEARKLDPDNTIVTQHSDPAAAGTSFQPEIRGSFDPSATASLQQAPAIAGPVTLLPTPGTQSFDVRADSRQTIQQVLSRYGINAVFDDSVKQQNLRFELNNVSYAQASSILFQMAHVFAVPLDPHSVLIANDTAENRQKLDRQLEETIYIPGFTPDRMKELGTIVQSVFDVKQSTVQSNAGSLVLRAPEGTLTAINLTLADLIDG